MPLRLATPLGIFNSTSVTNDALPPTDFTYELKDWRIANVDPWRFVGDVSDPAELEHLQEALKLIDPRTADMIELWAIRGLNQMEIAHIMGCTQPSVSYAVRSGIAKIQILLRRPNLTRSHMRGLVKRSWSGRGCNTWEDAYRCLVVYWDTRSQSETAERLGASQGWVRHQLLRVVENLRENLPDEPVAQQLATSILEILHAKVRRSQHARTEIWRVLW